MKYGFTLSLSSAVVAALLMSSAATADVAPPEQPPGSNITPVETTQVAMTAEYVEFIIESRPGSKGSRYGLASDTTQARVSATFTMTNRGTTAERMAVRFPLNSPSGASDGFGKYPEVQAIKASVNSRNVPTRVIKGAAFKPRRGDPVINWAAFDVAFPPQKDAVIRVSYILSATGESPEAHFNYVLQTGAGWRDTIGQATIVARLPYPVTNDNFFVDHDDWPKPTEFKGNEVRWVYRGLEPSAKDDIRFTVLEPKQWQDIQAARAAASASPNDGEKRLQLGRAYRRAIIFKYEPNAHTEQFYEPAKDSFRVAVKLLPKAAAARVELVQLLRELSFNLLGQAQEADLDNIEEIIGLLDEALRLDANLGAAQLLLRNVDADLRLWAQKSDQTQQSRIAHAHNRVMSIAKRIKFPLQTPTPAQFTEIVTPGALVQ
jgi:hypothetical protein